MKLWEKSYGIDQLIENFTVGQDRELDLYLAAYDVLGNMAHAHMLCEVGLLTADENKQLQKGLKALYKQATDGSFIIEDGIEDVHSQVEMLLTKTYGSAGKKIHTGRSRNDQVLVDLRLYFRAEIEAIAKLTQQLFNTLLQLAEKHQHQLMPGYTHMQTAMVSSFGLWFSAYAESLVDDLTQLQACHHIINQNPLGSAAGYGSSFPLNRKRTTELLGFRELNYNAIHAQMGRGKSELFMSWSMAGIAHTLGKLAMDVCLYMGQNYGFIALPDELTTGSSIMPHKKNPDVFELIRARCNQLLSLPTELSMMTSSLPAGYHRDFQLLKEALFPALHNLKSCLSIADYALGQIRVQDDLLLDDKYKYLYTVEVVNDEVSKGIPFRDAYKKVAGQIADGSFEPLRELNHTHEGSIGNLCLPEIKAKMEAAFAKFQFDRTHHHIQQLLDMAG
ncbi:MAG: argininosuccinate lyase [Bacteroidota bacterium]